MVNFMYKTILCDLDNTLLRHDKTVPEENLIAIKKAIDNGVSFILASGRSNMSLNVFNKQFGLNKKGNLCIAYNGGYIYEADTLKPLSVHYISPKISHKILSICNKYKNENCNPMLYKDNRLWVTKIDNRTELYCKRSFLKPIIVDNLENIVSDNINKIFILGENEVLSKIKNDADISNASDFASYFFSNDTILEFNPLNIDKGSALMEYAEIKNISCKEIISIGDNYNDISMIKHAGVGVAVANAVEPVLKVADYVTEADCDSGAVAEVINKYIL